MQTPLCLNKGRLLCQKPPLEPKEIWSLRIRLQLADQPRELELFNLAIDSKLRGCDLVSLLCETCTKAVRSRAPRLACSAGPSSRCSRDH